MPVPGIKPYQDIYKWDAYPYDPVRRGRFLAEAGYSEGFEFEFLVARWEGYRRHLI